MAEASPAVLKDSLILGAFAAFSNPYATFFQVSVLGSAVSGSSGDLLNLPFITDSIVDLSDSVLVVAMTRITYELAKMDVEQRAVLGLQTLPGAAGTARVSLFMPAIDAILVGKDSGSVPILARADFSTIKNPTYSDIVFYYLVDNLDSRKIVTATVSTLFVVRFFDLNTWTSGADQIGSDVSVAAYGDSTRAIYGMPPEWSGTRYPRPPVERSRS